MEKTRQYPIVRRAPAARNGVLAAAVLFSTGYAAGASEDALQLPSGMAVSFFESVTDQPGQGLTYRFRFVSPDIARGNGEIDSEVLERDMSYLCNNFALERVASTGPQPNQIVISIADRETPFGIADPEATQVFEAYSINDGACMWEPF